MKHRHTRLCPMGMHFCSSSIFMRVHDEVGKER
jgi:hypothetical protein